MRLTRVFLELFRSESIGGVLLILATGISLVLANSTFGQAYAGVWHASLAGHPVEFWINDGLMTVFFLMIGLELEREIYVGELSSKRQAILPLLAALGGMLVPAGTHALFNAGTPTASGAGIPMATDIAFAVGILSLLGDRVPPGLKVFLLALAVIDDLGAIVTIALFYSHGLAWTWLFAAVALFGVLLLLNRWKVNRPVPYLLLGAVLWYCMLRSGVHATISGVLLAFAIPFGDGGERSISYRLQRALHRPVAFGIMPLFALANTCIVLAPGWMASLASANSLGILLGLVLGKPVGITLFSFGAVALDWCVLPVRVSRPSLLAAAFLGGIGFTMSIFITLLAFQDPAHVDGSKTAILVGSLLAGTIGAVFLRILLPRKEQPNLSSR